MKHFSGTHRRRTIWTRRILPITMAAVMMIGPLSTTAGAYDALGSQNEIKSMELTKNGRKVQFYDIYNGQTKNRPDTNDQTQFFMDVVGNQENLTRWANLAYCIHECDSNSHWEHSNLNWDDTFGSGHYIDYVQDMLTARSTGGDDHMKSTGVCIANSLTDVQSRAANDIAGLIGRKVSGKDFLGHHNIDNYLKNATGPVIYSTVSTVDRYGKTPQFCYDSFTIAFYDFQLHVLDDGKALNTVTGDMSLEEAKKASPPNFSYTENKPQTSVVALTRNDSLEDTHTTVSMTQSTTETLSSSISNSSSYSFGQAIGVDVGIKVKIPMLEETTFDLNVGLDFEQAIGTAYSQEKSITNTLEKTTSTDLTVPAHTVATANQSMGKTQLTTTYDCPIGVTYKVAIFSMCGTVYDDNWLNQSFKTAGYDQRTFITIFGSDADGSDAVENLYQRGDKNRSKSTYEATYGVSYGVKANGSTWNAQLNWERILNAGVPRSSVQGLTGGDAMVKALDSRYPMSLTGASTSMESSIVTSELGVAQPLYPIDSITINYQLDRNFELAVGESLAINSYRVQAFDKDKCPYYGFVPAWGEWKIVDAKGNPTESSVAKVVKDSVTGEQRVLATAEGTAYVKYFINENTYVDYYGHVSSNASIKSAAYKIVVSSQSEPVFNGTIQLSGFVNAYVDDDPINLNCVDTLEAIAYDATGKESAVSLSWEAQELESRGIKVTEDGVLQVTKPGTFHVRAYCQDVYSSWVEVIAQEKPKMATQITETVKDSTTITTPPTFDENTMISRGDLITLLHQLADCPESAGSNAFADVDPQAARAAALNWARECGYINGTGDNQFDPDAGIDKQQLATIIYNIAKQHGFNVTMTEEEIAAILSRYVDSDQIADWARTPMAYSLQEGYLPTDESDSLNPDYYAEKWEATTAINDIAADTGLMPDTPATPVDENEPQTPTEGDEDEPQTPPEGEDELQTPTEGNEDEPQAPTEGEDEPQTPSEGEDELQTSTEGNEDEPQAPTETETAGEP